MKRYILLLQLVTLGASATEPSWHESFTEPLQIIDVATPEPGRISSVRARRGQHVKRDDLLMVLDDRVLQASRAVAALRATSESEVSGLVVERDMLRVRHQKLSELREQGHGNPDEVRRAEAEARIAAFKVQAAKENARMNQLQLAEIDARIETRHIRSPIDGVVTEVTRDEGEFVSATDPVTARVVDTSSLRVTYFLPTEEAIAISVSDKISVYFPGANQEATAVVEHVAEVTEAESGRVRVDVVLNNKAGKLRSGVRCRLETVEPANEGDDRA